MKRYIIIDVFLFVLFIAFTLICRFVDYDGTVGLSSFNGFFYTEYDKGYDVTSDVIMYFSIAEVFLLIFSAIIQMIKRKTIFKIDKIYYAFFIGAILLVVFWVLFDYAIILNYRPNMVEGKPKPSYPSTSLLLSVYCLFGFSKFISKYSKNKNIYISLYMVATLALFILFTFRIMSGMHYFTDCVAGVILGIFLVFIFLTFDYYFYRNSENNCE